MERRACAHGPRVQTSGAPRVTALFDTNILIDYLSGSQDARRAIERPHRRLISVVTWMEVLAGAKDDAEEDVIEMFLRDFSVIDVSRPIARAAVALRRSRRIRLPDAIIWATAQHQSALLVTRNTKDFPASEPDVHIPY